MIKATIAFLTIVILSTGTLQAGEVPRRTDQSSHRPNVLFISIDDLNDWIGALGGHPQAKTPNLDRLIARSVNFSNAHCAAPVCSASRHALLSGLRPSSTGWCSNSCSDEPEARAFLLLEETSSPAED